MGNHSTCALIALLMAISVSCPTETLQVHKEYSVFAPSFYIAARTLVHEMMLTFKGMDDVFYRAEKKLFQPKFDHLDLDHRWAGIIVNMYSSPDKIRNAAREYIYQNLNHVLPYDQSEIWIKFGDILKTAMNLIGEKKFKYLFRGEKMTNQNKLLDQPLTQRFYSTTTHPNVVKYFDGDVGIFYIILNAAGTDISEYSEMSDEEEVLIKPFQQFDIVLTTSLRMKIDEMLSKIKHIYPDFIIERFHPQMLVVLNQTVT